jgi:GTPase SAR1 family protein
LKPTKKQLFTILLIGEAGSGKTSFMSLLLNLFQGNGPLELVYKHDESKESGLNKTQIQTLKASLYTATASDGTKIQILDTPGLADLREPERVEKHKMDIENAIKEFVTSIDAVMIFLNGQTSRLPVTTSHTLDVLTSLFPRSIVDNISLIFTRSTVFTFNFRMDILPTELRSSKYWVLENPLIMYEKYQELKADNCPENLLKAAQRKLDDAYDEAVGTLDDWLKWLDDRIAQPTKEIDHLYQMSMQIEANMEAATFAITHLTEQRQLWERIHFELQDAEQVGFSVSLVGTPVNDHL